MESCVPIPVALPGLCAWRGTTVSFGTGVKEVYGVGRIERGGSEWWGAGKLWTSSPGCIW